MENENGLASKREGPPSPQRQLILRLHLFWQGHARRALLGLTGRLLSYHAPPLVEVEDLGTAREGICCRARSKNGGG